MQTCLLDDPDLGLITDNEHKLGMCLCEQCSCGSHQCPFIRPGKEISKSVYRSTYMTQYRGRKSPKSTPLVRQGQLGIIKARMEHQSVNQAAYRPYEIKSQVRLSPTVVKPQTKFISNSSYRQNFLSWSPVETFGLSTEATGGKYSPVTRPPDQKFSGESTYKTEFTKKLPGTRSVSVVHQQNKNLLDMSYKSPLQTTSQSHFRSVSSNLRGPSYVNIKPNVDLEVPCSIYETESHRAFQRHRSFFKDPRALKRIFKGRFSLAQ